MIDQWKKLSLIVVVSVTAILAGCSSDLAPSGSAAPAAAAAGPAGGAFLGPITGADVQLFNVNADGSNVIPALETVPIDATGFKFTKAPGAIFRICVTGGTYPDESTGLTITNTLTLCALVDASKAGTGRISVSPLTTFTDNLTVANRQLTGAGNLQAELGKAVNVIKTFFALTGDPALTEPLPAPPNAGLDPTGDRYKQAILLGGWSQQGTDYLAKCGNVPAERHELLKALFQDVKDGVFDGKLNAAAPRLNTKCNAVDTPMPIGTGTADLINAIKKFAGTTLGTAMQIATNPTVTAAINQNIATGALAPPAVKVAAGQGLIAIDGKNNIGYVPIYAIDANLNAKIAVVDLTVGAANPILKVLSLPGSTRPIAATINPDTGKVYVEAQTPANTVNVHVIDTTTQTVTATVLATGVTFSGSFGGIIANPTKQKLIVAGSSNIGIMSLATDPPTMIANSLISNSGTDSIALNFDTEVLFVSSDGTMSAVNTAVNPPTQFSVLMGLGTTDGVAFDTLTNLLAVDPEFQDQTHILNFNGAVLAQNMTLPFVTVPGYGTTAPVGEGPGGQAVVNVITHQAVVADEFGENVRVIQLPSAPIVGPPNNKGQFGTATTADASSAFSLATTILPKPLIGTVATQLSILGDPNSLTMDPGRNFVYMLADTTAGFTVGLRAAPRHFSSCVST